MRLNKRVTDLEARIDPPPPAEWVRVLKYEDQTEAEAIAAHEAEHGAIAGRNVVLRAIISKPGPAPENV